MELTTALDLLAGGEDLTAQDAQSVFDQIMAGEASPPQIAGILMALRTKGEVAAEVTGAAQAMRNASTKVEVELPNLVDTAGTGGSGVNKLFNVSTAAAFVAAAGGAHVAKHGNRGVSSGSGSADVLEAAGIALDHSPEQIARCIKEVGVGFMFAQVHHTAMRHAGPVRAALGVRTVFNMLGPLTNPAGAKRQVIGTFSETAQTLIVEAAKSLGGEHVVTMHADGLDEFSISGFTHVAELKDGEIIEYDVEPEDFGLTTDATDSLKAETPDSSLALIKEALSNQGNVPARNLVAMNGGAALYAAGIASNLQQGIEFAMDVISTGQAKQKLQELIDFSTALRSS